jgi:hypothetical protein
MIRFVVVRQMSALCFRVRPCSLMIGSPSLSNSMKLPRVGEADLGQLFDDAPCGYAKKNRRDQSSVSFSDCSLALRSWHT